MSAARRRSLSSRIVRRVQAHAGVAVLFRKSAALEGALLSQPAPERTKRAVPARLEALDPLLPFGRVIGGAPLEPPAPLILPPAPAMTGESPPALRPRPVIAEAPGALPVEMPLPETVERSLEEDWPRLQNIIQRHQEAETAPAPPAAKPARRTQQAARKASESAPQLAGETKEIQKAPLEPAIERPRASLKKAGRMKREKLETAAVVQKTEAEAPPHEVMAQPKAAHEDKPRRRTKPAKTATPGVQTPRAERRVEETRTAEIQAKAEQPAPAKSRKVEPQAIPSEQPAQDIQRLPVEKPAAPKKSTAPPNIAPVSKTIPPETSAVGEEPAVEQLMPLQAAWPAVQRKPVDAIPAPVETPAVEPTAPIRAELPAPEKMRVKQVESLLQKVEAKQPTESRVEVITPRRPRPTAPAKPVQAKPEPAEQPLEEEPAVEPSRVAPKDKQPPKLEQVETEIGPLPADLWQLIGQPVPEPVPQTAELVETARPAQAKPAQTEGYLWPEEEAPSESEEGGELQMQAEVGAPPPAGTPGAAAGTGSEVNIDELARQVYREIKKRFSIELERFRRKK